jgi:exodeoxyribonuclease V beta subunit
MSVCGLDALTFPISGMRLIEASAGTGKTYTIANLYLRLLLGLGRDHPLGVDSILVVTFTTAATQELRERVRQRIVHAHDAFQLGKSDDPFIAGLIAAIPDAAAACVVLDAAQRHMDEAAIYTIHGFCHRALVDNAFDSGTAFDLEMVIDETLLRQQAAEDFWRRQLAILDADTASLLPADWSSPDALLRSVSPYLGSQQLLIEPDSNWVQDKVAILRADVEEFKRLWLEQDVRRLLLDFPFKENSRAGNRDRIDEMQRFCESNGFEFISSRKESWALWSPMEIVKATPKAEQVLQHPAFDLCERIAEAFAHLRQSLRIYLSGEAINWIPAAMQVAKQELNQLSPDDLLRSLASALDRPGSGPRLAQLLAQRYPLVMVDEFQDTDGLQYRIFDSIYGDRDANGWIMIGDPKQAIYKFRGADVFTYISARRRVVEDPAGLFSLDTNWRSSSAMVAAVNQLFERAERTNSSSGAFMYPEDIPFRPVRAAPSADREPMLVNGSPVVPLTMFYCRGEDKKGRLTSGRARELLAQQTAGKIVELLNAATDQQLTIADEPLAPGNIAVLVRERKEASAVKEALAQRGVNSVFLSRESVFDAPVAADLYHVLQAVFHPADERKLRSALATPLLDVSLRDIAALDDDIRALQALQEEFAAYRQRLQRFGVLSMLRQLMAQRDLPARLLAQPGGQRSLTDLRHLGELLQQASEFSGGLHELLRWYLRHLNDRRRPDNDSQRVRLESDDKLVQIVTIHASKGLEYDVVFVPLASFARENADCIFHRPCDPPATQDFVTVADLAATSASQKLSEKERLAEDIRLLYVALTRARYQCYLGIANIAQRKPVLPFSATALAYVLGHSGAEMDEPQLLEELQNLCVEFGDEMLALEVFNGSAIDHLTSVRWPKVTPGKLTLPELPTLARDSWSLTSYSALARGFSGPAPQRGAGDEQELASVEESASDEYNPATFPRGPRFGTLLHNILESIDFACDQQSLFVASQHQLDLFGLDREVWGEVVTHWLRRVLTSPLPPLDSLSLEQLPPAARVSEMEFNFALNRSINAAALDRILRHRGYLAYSPVLEFNDVSGIMRGFVDLVFEHDGRFYVVDYKSNYLGPGPASYDQGAMAQAIGAHRYDLQYLIYSVALHRYLAARIPDYDYGHHFGGIFYLFLRGMTGTEAAGHGVFYELPASETIAALDRFFAGRGEA